VQAHPLGGHVGERHIERLHVVFHAGEEGRIGLVAEVEVALHGEVRCVDLEQMAAADNERVFRLQLPREREEVIAVRRVVGVVHDCEHAAGGGRSHEGLGEALLLLGERVFEGIALRPDAGTGRVVADLGDRLGRVHDA